MFDNLNRITDRLDKLISQHSQNAIEITNRVYFTREELDGLPADYFEGRSAHIIDGIAKFIVTTKIPDYEPVMRFAKSAETRKQMFTAFSSRCHENIPLLQEAVDLRRKSAQILGYRSHAEFVLKRQMAETPDAVLAMLNKVRGAVAGSHKAKLDELAELKKKDMADKPYDGFFDWDLGYYGRVFAETACSYDLEEIRQYFPVKHVVGAILDIYQKMLGLQITRLDLAEPAWDSDVEMFEVREASDATKVVGYFYVDLYSREGKYNNAAQYPISDGYERPDGTRHLPVSALMANFPKPQGTANDQALLSHTSVQTLMHETGHVFHHLCARTKWCTLHYGQMERDFIEIPSKMLENWCWQPDVLRKISAHHNTGLPLSGDKIQRIVDMRHRIAQFGYMSTAFLALYDMTIHNSSSSVDVAQTYVAMSKNIVLSNQGDAELVPRLGSITHLMSGYDARYYSYLWSDIFGADIFSSRFIKEGLDNPQTGMDYRTEILQPGASRPAKLSIARFLGRNPSSTAFFRNIN
ncbi:metalloendopeptidase [Coemansia sp. RSA 1933]|nr:metalloendopeptidase [Coemansia sp. RSA 1933]